MQRWLEASILTAEFLVGAWAVNINSICRFQDLERIKPAGSHVRRKRKPKHKCKRKKIHVRGGSNIFLRRGAPLRNGVADW